MSWVRPTAPAPERALGLKPDSARVMAASNRGSTPAFVAAASMAPAHGRPASGRASAQPAGATVRPVADDVPDAAPNVATDAPPSGLPPNRWPNRYDVRAYPAEGGAAVSGCAGTPSTAAPWDIWLSTEANDQGDATRWRISAIRVATSATALRSIAGDSSG